MSHYDVTVIGGGAAGPSAALVLSRAQVITAAGAGSAAAIAINADLVEEDVRNAVRDLDHGITLVPTITAHSKEPA
jgi:thioredoxin reductase